MTTNEIMSLDCRKEENKEIIQKVLRKIKPLSKYPDGCDIPFEAIEKIITVMCKKYCMQIKSLNPDVWANKNHTIWRATLTEEINYTTIEIVYGLTIYEVFAKCAIRLYTEVKKGIEIRE